MFVVCVCGGCVCVCEVLCVFVVGCVFCVCEFVGCVSLGWVGLCVWCVCGGCV